MEQHKVGVLVKLKVHPEKKEALIDHLIASSANIASNEHGTEIFIVSTSPSDDSAVYIYEVYASEEAKVLHESSEPYIQSRVEANNLFEGMPEILILNPQGGKGLRLVE